MNNIYDILHKCNVSNYITKRICNSTEITDEDILSIVFNSEVDINTKKEILESIDINDKIIKIKNTNYRNNMITEMIKMIDKISYITSKKSYNTVILFTDGFGNKTCIKSIDDLSYLIENFDITLGSKYMSIINCNYALKIADIIVDDNCQIIKFKLNSNNKHVISDKYVHIPLDIEIGDKIGLTLDTDVKYIVVNKHKYIEELKETYTYDDNYIDVVPESIIGNSISEDIIKRTIKDRINNIDNPEYVDILDDLSTSVNMICIEV